MTATRSGRDDLALGPIRPSLTGSGKTVVIGLVVAAFLAFQAQSDIYFGLLIVLLVIGGIDYAWSRRLLTETDVDVICVKRMAAEPDGLAYSVTGPAGTALQLRMFGQAGLHDPKFLTGERMTIRPGPGQTANRTYIDYRISRCVIGFVSAHRDAVRLTSVRMSQAPPAWDDDRIKPVPSPRIDDLERIREYLPGDRRSRISWSATARTGVVHVRDDLVVSDQVMVIVIELGQRPQMWDAVAGRVAKVAALTRLCVESAWANGYQARIISWYDSDAYLKVAGLAAANKIDPGHEVVISSAPVAYCLDGLVDDMNALIDRLGGLAYVDDPTPLPPLPYFQVSAEGVWLAD